MNVKEYKYIKYKNNRMYKEYEIYRIFKNTQLLPNSQL